jgi:hypothetical protein
MLFNNARSRLLIVIIVLNRLMPDFLSGQTQVTGKVTDIQTFEPIVFANVIFSGTTIGTKSGFDGTYTLTGITESDSIVISFIGYDTKTIAVTPGINQVIDVRLQPAIYSLSEITVRPGENPAISLLKKVWKNIPLNHIEKLSAYQYENYSRSTVYVRKLRYYKKTDNSYIKPFSKEFDKFSIKTGPEYIPAIPSYFTETVSDNFYEKSSGLEYTYIRATNSEGIAFENTSLPAQLITKQENFNFMNNNVLIIDKSFISPLSRFGTLYYKYYLSDTLFIDKRYCYEVNFVPRNEEGPVFHGSFWINDTTYALKRISVELGQKAELNFIRRIKIQQEYEPADSSAWFPVETRFMADAANLFVTNYSRKTKIVVNQPHEPGFYNSELKVDPDAEDFDDQFWSSARSNSLEKIDSLAIQKIDSLKNDNRISVTARLIEAAIKGYYNFGKLEAGPYLLLYNHNNVEGSRFRIGGRTNIDFSKNLVIEGYAALGLKDKRIKGSVQAEVFLSKKSWTKTGIQIRDDIENAGSLDEFYSQSSFLTFASNFGGSDKMARSRVIRTWIESDLFRGMQGSLVFTSKSFVPVGQDFHFAWYSDRQKATLKDSYLTSEAGLILRYQPKAVYVIDGIRRFPVNFNQYPVFSLEYFRGFRDLAGGDFSYSKLVTGISQKFNPGVLGSVSYDLRFTKVFGTLPYPLLTTLAGNESFFRTDRTYNLMNYGEFIADETLELSLSYHMNSLVLGKIPLLKNLDLRTVFTGNAAFGSFNEESNGFYDPGINPDGILPEYDKEGKPLTRFNTISYSHPYAELSYGIENIFKFFRIDLVHRLTYLDNRDINKYAVKISGVFRF